MCEWRSFGYTESKFKKTTKFVSRQFNNNIYFRTQENNTKYFNTHTLKGSLGSDVRVILNVTLDLKKKIAFNLVFCITSTDNSRERSTYISH